MLTHRGEHERKKRIVLTIHNRQNSLFGVYFFAVSLSRFFSDKKIQCKYLFFNVLQLRQNV